MMTLTFEIPEFFLDPRYAWIPYTALAYFLGILALRNWPKEFIHNNWVVVATNGDRGFLVVFAPVCLLIFVCIYIWLILCCLLSCLAWTIKVERKG